MVVGAKDKKKKLKISKESVTQKYKLKDNRSKLKIYHKKTLHTKGLRKKSTHFLTRNKYNSDY